MSAEDGNKQTESSVIKFLSEMSFTILLM